MLNKQISFSSHMNNSQITKGKKYKKANSKVSFCQEKGHTIIFIYRYNYLSILTRKDNRPKGITFIAILTLVSGLLSIVSGDLIFLILGIISIVMFYGLLKGREWAWSVTILVSVFNIVASVTFWSITFLNPPVINSNNPLILGSIALMYKIGINVIILYYLYRPHVKIFFGKSTI